MTVYMFYCYACVRARVCMIVVWRVCACIIDVCVCVVLCVTLKETGHPELFPHVFLILCGTQTQCVFLLHN